MARVAMSLIRVSMSETVQVRARPIGVRKISAIATNQVRLKKCDCITANLFEHHSPPVYQVLLGIQISNQVFERVTL